MILDVQSASAAYGSREVLKELSFSVHSGEIVALIGPNGAGKSTLIRAVSGILPITDGQVLLNGKDLNTLSIIQRARLVAVVPQASLLGGAFTVEQTVLLGRTPYISMLGRPKESDMRCVREALLCTSLVESAQRRVAELSGGEQQRVLLARALAQSTPILLLDEPTSHLDLKHQSEFLKLVKRLTREQELAVLVAMHDLNLVSIVADRVVLLQDGKIAAIGSPSHVLSPSFIKSVYQIQVDIQIHPKSGRPVILMSDIDSEEGGEEKLDLNDLSDS